MHLYNITWNHKEKPDLYNKSCHINADDISELYVKFKQAHRTAFIWGLVVIDK